MEHLSDLILILCHLGLRLSYETRLGWIMDKQLLMQNIIYQACSLTVYLGILQKRSPVDKKQKSIKSGSMSYVQDFCTVSFPTTTENTSARLLQPFAHSIETISSRKSQAYILSVRVYMEWTTLHRRLFVLDHSLHLLSGLWSTPLTMS